MKKNGNGNGGKKAPPRPPMSAKVLDFKAKQRAATRTSPTKPVGHISECAREYLCALEDPFNCKDLACVPKLPSTPSRKVKAFIKGALATGTLGYGFVAARPLFSNNTYAMTSTSALFAGDSVVTSAIVGVIESSTNSDYVTSQFGSGSSKIQGRVVGCGIRVKYTGTQLNMNGQIRCLEESNHNDVGGFNTAIIDAFDKTSKMSVSREWVSVSYHPISEAETQYSPTQYNNGSTNMILCLFITAIPNSTFDFEFYEIFEAIGNVTRGKTPSHSDQVGVDAVLNVVQSRPKDGYEGTVPIPNLLNSVGKALVDTVSSVGSWLWNNKETVMAVGSALL
jgi:hypothetical protein